MSSISSGLQAPSADDEDGVSQAHSLTCEATMEGKEPDTPSSPGHGHRSSSEY